MHESGDDPKVDVSLNGKNKNDHPYFIEFRDAKNSMQDIFSDINVYFTDFSSFIDKYFNDDRFKTLLDEKTHETVQSGKEKVHGIKEVIARNQMKCAFFGRTSNGKSTVINAMLGSKILPSGIGHTTSCFVQIQGTGESSAHIMLENKEQSINNVYQLAHALSDAKLASDSLLEVYWPDKDCDLLREDVQLLDSPGVNVDPDMDSWIDKHCLDADVFVLVVNSESTLMQAEKDFFHKVSQKLSKPNIFILNNRWDASASEGDYAEDVRKQHMERSCHFLAKELQVCTVEEARERVFFVSAREVLSQRISSGSQSPPGSAPNHGSPMPGSVPMSFGWEERLSEFRDFEKQFEKILSSAATQTKFKSHAMEGSRVIKGLIEQMESLSTKCLTEKTSAERCASELRIELDQLRGELQERATKIQLGISRLGTHIESLVGTALAAELKQLGRLVDAFEPPFHPDPALLTAYKRSLSEHVEKALGEKLLSACATSISSEVLDAQTKLAHYFDKFIPDATVREQLHSCVQANAFEPRFHVDCRNLCADFQEDLSFRFSLGWTNLALLMSSNQSHVAYQHSVSSMNEGALFANTGARLLPLLSKLGPNAVTRSAFASVLLVGVAVRAAGWRFISLGAGLYGALYCYERLAWTNKAKEDAFKRQYVAYAANKLRLIANYTSGHVRFQVEDEVGKVWKTLQKEVEEYVSTVDGKVKELDTDIAKLTQIHTQTTSFTQRAMKFCADLHSFCSHYKLI